MSKPKKFEALSPRLTLAPEDVFPSDFEEAVAAARHAMWNASGGGEDWYAPTELMRAALAAAWPILRRSVKP